ncbi:cytochrome-c oxidase, cbb3-type subunit II [Candidatus Albibeggiatoa sp. nov. BB20]|uniref:cytochrome-c oxidase, cbb3-type subunit II n=1 Tax=Candidatus Albibeggiatoa sp. nov. BB20 TaxID=3162723 RepID=UPI00336557DD
MAASTGHEKVEKNLGLMIILIILVISVGGLIQIVPLFYMKDMIEPADGLKPYSAIQLAGRDIYIRESCSVCHSQMIRPFRAETERYGHYSVASEFVYDRPFQWGSKRTGPDLHRVGGRYSDEWHVQHLMDPRSVVPESVMPGYPWLAEGMVDGNVMQYRMQQLKNVFGHPYSQEEIDKAPTDLDGVTELDAIVAYLQGMGTTVKTVR